MLLAPSCALCFPPPLPLPLPRLVLFPWTPAAASQRILPCHIRPFLPRVLLTACRDLVSRPLQTLRCSCACRTKPTRVSVPSRLSSSRALTAWAPSFPRALGSWGHGDPGFPRHRLWMESASWLLTLGQCCVMSEIRTRVSITEQIRGMESVDLGSKRTGPFFMSGRDFYTGTTVTLMGQTAHSPERALHFHSLHFFMLFPLLRTPFSVSAGEYLGAFGTGPDGTPLKPVLTPAGHRTGLGTAPRLVTVFVVIAHHLTWFVSFHVPTSLRLCPCLRSGDSGSPYFTASQRITHANV